MQQRKMQQRQMHWRKMQQRKLLNVWENYNKSKHHINVINRFWLIGSGPTSHPCHLVAHNPLPLHHQVPPNMISRWWWSCTWSQYRSQPTTLSLYPNIISEEDWTIPRWKDQFILQVKTRPRNPWHVRPLKVGLLSVNKQQNPPDQIMTNLLRPVCPSGEKHRHWRNVTSYSYIDPFHFFDKFHFLSLGQEGHFFTQIK